MKSIALCILCWLTAAVPGYSQTNDHAFAVVSYNVENLFDTADAAGFDDDAFTPSGEKQWTRERYEKKVADLARVILSIPGEQLPAIIGLAEVENNSVLRDLAGQPGLEGGKYEIVHEDGQDPRGIECALLYRPDLFEYSSHRYIPIEDPVDPDYQYRGILHVTGTGPEGSNLHIFMNHWKSRSGDQEVTERQRMFSAITLRKQLDTLYSAEPGFKAIIMGDFNDEPTNRSMVKGVSATNKRKNIHVGEQYNLHYDAHHSGGLGTYNYRGNWNMLDQIIVSYNLLNQEVGLSTTFEGGRILKEEWMLYDSQRYNDRLPSSTYGGPEYYGGPSDHLPVYVIFTW